MQIQNYQDSVTIAMWAGIIPTALLGAGLAMLRLNWLTKTIAQRFR